MLTHRKEEAGSYQLEACLCKYPAGGPESETEAYKLCARTGQTVRNKVRGLGGEVENNIKNL